MAAIICAETIDELFEKGTAQSTTESDVSNMGQGGGNQVDGEKSKYERSKGVEKIFFNSVRLSHNLKRWNNFTGCAEEEFKEIFLPTLPEVRKPINVRAEFTEAENSLRNVRKLGMWEKLMLSVYFILRGGNEGGIRIRAAAHFYGLSVRRTSNYLRQVSWALYKCLKTNSNAEVR